MKKVKFILLFCTIIWSCGGGNGGDEIPIPTPVNKAPSIPLLIFPTDNLLCIDNVLNFNWSPSIDPEGDVLTYQIQVADDNLFTQIVHSLNSSFTEQTISLSKGRTYYWRVKSIDSKNLESSFSSVFSFYTDREGELNHLPFSPFLVAPALNSIQDTTIISLEWTANDVDNDPLLFDVFFGINNPPNVKIAENLIINTYSVVTESSKNYYWKVVVEDDKGGRTIGQTWNFKTD